jgi:glycosyltransferase involved in cell wall biosynthesis
MRHVIAPPSEAPVDPGTVPTFSIVIPAYQASAFVGDAVASALSQTVPAHEIIVCDDGSTDDLAAALAPYEDRITLVRRPHRGVAAARNAAVETASGEFVAMLDADDVYEPARLEALGALAAARPDLDILATDLWLEEEEEAERDRFYDTLDFPSSDQRLAILEACFVSCPGLRRSRVLEEGGFDESYDVAEDWDLFMRLILGGSCAGLIPEPLVRYRRHLSSSTADRARSLWARVTVLEKAELHPTLTEAERAFLNRCLARARTRARLNDAKALAVSRSRDVRRSLLRLVLADETPAPTRLVAAAAAVAPRPGAAVLGWEERRVAKSRPRRPGHRRRLG